MFELEPEPLIEQLFIQSGLIMEVYNSLLMFCLLRVQN